MGSNPGYLLKTVILYQACTLPKFRMILCTYLGSMIPCDVRWRHRIQIDCTRQTYGAPYFDVDRSLSMNLGMSSCNVRKHILRLFLKPKGIQ